MPASRRAEVVRERGNRKTLQCHYHAWTYGPGRIAPDGAAVGTRARVRLVGPVPRPAPARTAGAAPLSQSRTRRRRPWPRSPRGSPSLLADGGIDLDALVFDRRLDFSLEANWKVVIENYLECYHCPTAHQDFSRAVDVNPDRYELQTDALVVQPARAGEKRRRLVPVPLPLAEHAHQRLPGDGQPLDRSRAPGRARAYDRLLDYFFGPDVSEAEKEELHRLRRPGRGRRPRAGRVGTARDALRAPGARAPDAGERAADRALPGARAGTRFSRSGRSPRRTSGQACPRRRAGGGADTARTSRRSALSRAPP